MASVTADRADLAHRIALCDGEVVRLATLSDPTAPHLVAEVARLRTALQRELDRSDPARNRASARAAEEN